MLGEIAGEVAGNLGDEEAGRTIGDTEDVHHSALEIDDEQRIELGELDGVHDEEVGGQDAARLDGEELLPGRSTARSWSETVASKSLSRIFMQPRWMIGESVSRRSSSRASAAHMNPSATSGSCS